MTTMIRLENWWLPALNLLLQSTVILGVGLLVAWALRRRYHSPVQRVLALRAALCATALSALLCVALPGRVRPLWNLQRATPVAAPAPPMIEAPPLTAQETRVKVASPANISPPMVIAPTLEKTSEKAAPLRLKYLVVLCWLSVTAALLLWNMACHFHLWRLRRCAIEIDDESAVQLLSQLAREMKISAPRLLHSAQVSGPLLCGLWRPVLLWPAHGEFDGDINARRAIFVHELAHLQRRDLWWNVLSRAVCALLWPQVLAWRVARQLEASSEECCDAAVIEAGCAPREYAACLLDWAERWSLPRAERVAGAGVVPLRSSLGRRVQAILDDSKRGSLRLSRRARCVAGLVMCGSVGLSLLVGAAEVKVAKNDSPEATVRTFVQALNDGDEAMILSLVAQSKPSVALTGMMKRVKEFQIVLAIKDLRIRNYGSSTTATATVKLQMQGEVENKAHLGDFVSLVDLKRVGEVWKIIPPQSWKVKNDDFLQMILRGIAPPKWKELEAWAKNRDKATITGRVVDERERPLPNVKLSVQMFPEEMRSIPGVDTMGELFMRLQYLPINIRSLFVQSVETDANGIYRVNGLTTATYEIFVQPDIRIGASKNDAMPKRVASIGMILTTREGKVTKALAIGMNAGTVIEAQVLDKTTGLALPGVRISSRIESSDINVRNSSLVETIGQGMARLRVSTRKVFVGINGDFLPGVRTWIVKANGKKYALSNVEASVDGKPSSYNGNVGFKVSYGQVHTVIFLLQPYKTPVNAKR